MSGESDPGSVCLSSSLSPQPSPSPSSWREAERELAARQAKDAPKEACAGDCPFPALSVFCARPHLFAMRDLSRRLPCPRRPRIYRQRGQASFLHHLEPNRSAQTCSKQLGHPLFES